MYVHDPGFFEWLRGPIEQFHRTVHGPSSLSTRKAPFASKSEYAKHARILPGCPCSLGMPA